MCRVSVEMESQERDKKSVTEFRVTSTLYVGIGFVLISDVKSFLDCTLSLHREIEMGFRGMYVSVGQNTGSKEILVFRTKY